MGRVKKEPPKYKQLKTKHLMLMRLCWFPAVCITKTAFPNKAPFGLLHTKYPATPCLCSCPPPGWSWHCAPWTPRAAGDPSRTQHPTPLLHVLTRCVLSHPPLPLSGSGELLKCQLPNFEL